MRKKSLSSAFFITLLCILLTNTFKTEVFAQSTPKIAIVSLDHVPFVEGNNNEFYISAKNYTGQVQYQLFYIQESVMKQWQIIDNKNMVYGWTNPVDAQTPIIVDISSLNLKADKYRFAIRVRRVGVKGLYQNNYGDYDDAYPFNVDVVKTADIDLSGNVNIQKTSFSKSENLVINGVGNLSKDIQYKLHLFDVKNNKWLENLTEYNTSINYSLKDISEGTYIVDLWAKNTNSEKRYDGWKLKTITVQNSLPNDKVVKFPDSNLDKVIRELINKPYGDIYKGDVDKIESVEWFLDPDIDEIIPAEEMIFDLSGIENLTNLKVLSLQGNSISDLSKLAGLTNLEYLDLYFNDISDLSALKGLTNLVYLDLSENNVSDISALTGLTNLEYLDLYSNDISDLSALKELINLETLDLYSNQISDISALKELTNLTYLGLYENKIIDITTLAGLNNLEYLDLYSNNISDISALKGLTNLKHLSLFENNISDISALKGLTNLEHLTLFQNNISDIVALKGLINLSTLDLSGNNISDIAALKGLINLTYLDLSYGSISDISSLSELINLETLILSNNKVSNINSLKGLPYLMWVELNNNQISSADMQSLKDALPEGAELQ